MYAYIKGILAEITEDAIIVENQGIGYEIAVPGQVFDYLPSVGEEVKIYTWTRTCWPSTRCGSTTRSWSSSSV